MNNNPLYTFNDLHDFFTKEQSITADVYAFVRANSNPLLPQDPVRQQQLIRTFLEQTGQTVEALQQEAPQATAAKELAEKTLHAILAVYPGVEPRPISNNELPNYLENRFGENQFRAASFLCGFLGTKKMDDIPTSWNLSYPQQFGKMCSNTAFKTLTDGYQDLGHVMACSLAAIKLKLTQKLLSDTPLTEQEQGIFDDQTLEPFDPESIKTSLILNPVSHPEIHPRHYGSDAWQALLALRENMQDRATPEHS